MSFRLPHKLSDLLTDVVSLLLLTYLTALFVELFKPGLISNFTDLNVWLLAGLLGLICLLLFGRSGYQPTAWQKFYYFVWFSGWLLLLVRWLLKNATSNNIYLAGLTAAVVITLVSWLAYRRQQIK